MTVQFVTGFALGLVVSPLLIVLVLAIGLLANPSRGRRGGKGSR